MRFQRLARRLVAAYHQVMGEPVDFWPAYTAEVRKAVTADAQRAAHAQRAENAQRAATLARYRRDHPADAPTDQTRPLRATRTGLQRGVTHIGRITSAADPAAAASRGVSASH